MGKVFRFIPILGLNVRQRQDMDKAIFEKRTESADVPPTKVSFGPFCLLPTQFLLLEGDKVVSTPPTSRSTCLRCDAPCPTDGTDVGSLSTSPDVATASSHQSLCRETRTEPERQSIRSFEEG